MALASSSMMTGHRALHDYALLPSPLGRRDARVKLLLLLAYTVGVVTTPVGLHAPFAGYAALLLLAAGASSLPWGVFFRSFLLLLPLLAGVALFIPFHAGGSGVGWPLFQGVATKSILATGAALLLAATTPFPQITAALEQFRVPRLFVLILSFTYRYLFVLMEEAQRMKRARDSRGYRARHLGQALIIGRMVGTLFLRSYDRAERVHRAMLSRGHTHQSRTTAAPRVWSKVDTAFLLVSLASLASLYSLNF